MGPFGAGVDGRPPNTSVPGGGGCGQWRIPTGQGLGGNGVVLVGFLTFTWVFAPADQKC